MRVQSNVLNGVIHTDRVRKGQQDPPFPLFPSCKQKQNLSDTAALQRINCWITCFVHFNSGCTFIHAGLRCKTHRSQLLSTPPPPIVPLPSHNSREKKSHPAPSLSLSRSLSSPSHRYPVPSLSIFIPATPGCSRRDYYRPAYHRRNHSRRRPRKRQREEEDEAVDGLRQWQWRRRTIAT